MTDAAYVLAIRADRPDHAFVEELQHYLRGLAELIHVIVVDGSPPDVYATHDNAWGADVRHCPPDPAFTFSNGKVNGVLTGLQHAAGDKVVIADDDVRYGSSELRRVLDLLDDCDLVRPTNYFDPLPWHARWDTARTLINRAFGSDFPGTLAVRKSALPSHGYDGDVMFENLELIRTVRANRGRECAPADLFVRRVPPSTRHFRSQRVRQAYDEFARPGRLAVFLGLGPMFVTVLRKDPKTAALLLVVPSALAAIGRARGGGRRVFGWDAIALAPLWTLERAVTSWLAVAERCRFGGVRYNGRVIRTAAHPMRELRSARTRSCGTGAAEVASAG